MSKLVGAAQAAGATPVLSIYALPHRDCYSYAAGGFGSADGYRAWIDAISAGLGGAPAAISPKERLASSRVKTSLA